MMRPRLFAGPGVRFGLLALIGALTLWGCQKPAHVSWELANPAVYQPPDRTFLQACDGCHAADGLSAGTPPRPVPRLRGQQAVYLAAAMRAYRDGTRSNPTMREAVSGLTDDQIDLAAKLLGGPTLPPPPAPPAAPPPLTVQGICAGCHGQTGLAVIPDYPRIGGQQEAYLKAALEDYRAGRRSNPIMRTFARELTPEQLDEAATYFAARSGLSAVIPEPAP